MKIDFEQKLKGPWGEFAKDAAGKEVSLGAICMAALLVNEQIEPAEKLERYNLANKVQFSFDEQDPNDELGVRMGTEFTVQELALIESLVGKHQSTWVYGVVHGVFNSSDLDKEKAIIDDRAQRLLDETGQTLLESHNSRFG